MSDSSSQMTKQSAPPRTTASADSHLPDRWRLPAQIVWFAVVAEMVGLTIAGAAPRFNQLIAQSGADHTLLESIGVRGGLYVAVFFGWAVLIFAVFCIPAAIIYWRRPDDWTALLVSLTLFAVGCVSPNFADALRDLYATQLTLLAIPVDFIRSASEGLPVVTLIVFPTGLAAPRWMRWMAFGMLGWTLVRPLLFFTALHPLQWSASFLVVWLLATLGGAVFAQVYRYIHVSTPAQKQQTKWIVFGGAIAIFGLIALKAALAIFPVLSTPGTTTFVVWKLIEYSIYSICLLPVPLAFTLSILRYRLWDIDFIINRSLVYGGLTALLVAVFGVSLFAAQQVIRAATGGGEIPMLGIVASAMVVGSLFQPARTKLRRLVDQRLYGIQIDYKRALHRVAARELVVQRLRDTKTSFGAYTDIQLVGRGGMGEVYRGTHPILKRSVAIKLLPMALISDETARKRFLREAQTIGRLEHANIISIQDYGEAEGMPYMVMDFVEGLSLNEYMHQRGPLPLEEAKFVLEDVASALDYAHSQGVIHRDIKPSNVMLQPITHSRALKGRLYRAVLMDFGIAKIVSDATSQLTTTGMMGTIDYIAPEQIQGAADVTRAADIYSLGVVAYEMLTGRLPFKHANPAAMLIAHLLEPAPDPRSTRPDLSDRAGSAILRALAKTPAERFNSAEEFVMALG